MGCGAVERDWKAWIPLEVVKSDKGDMRIGGIATDENAKDLQGEKVFIAGLDTSYLTQRGAFNWNHGKGPGDILGEVDTVQKNVDQGTMYVEGFLYPKVDEAVKVYNLMQSMKDSGSERKLGLSLEGKVKERDSTTGKQIKKAWIKNVAVTYNPINQGTWVDMIKSLGENFTFEKCDCDCTKCTFCDESESKKSPPGVNDLDPRDTPGEQPAPLELDPRGPIRVEDVCPKCGKIMGDGCVCPTAVPDAHEYIGLTEKAIEDHIKVWHEDPAQKAIAAGHDIPATSGGVSGSALRDEELEKDPKTQTYDEKEFKKKKKVFTKSEVFDLFLKKGYSDTNAALATILIVKAIEIPGYTRIRRGKFERVKAHSRLLQDAIFRSMLEDAYKRWSAAGKPKEFAPWLRETEPKTYKLLITDIGGAHKMEKEPTFMGMEHPPINIEETFQRQGPGEMHYRKFGANIPDPTEPSAGDTVEVTNGVRGRITGMDNTSVEVTLGSGRIEKVPKVVLSGEWEPRKQGEGWIWFTEGQPSKSGETRRVVRVGGFPVGTSSIKNPEKALRRYLSKKKTDAMAGVMGGPTAEEAKKEMPGGKEFYDLLTSQGWHVTPSGTQYRKGSNLISVQDPQWGGNWLHRVHTPASFRPFTRKRGTGLESLKAYLKGLK